MKRALTIVLVFLLTVAALTACGGGGNNNNNSGGDSASVSGETFDTTIFSVLVPKGWMAFNASDFFKDYADLGYDPYGVSVYKGAKTEWDQLTCPGMQINYYHPDKTLWEPSSDYYEDVVDLGTVKIGSWTWKGFTGTSSGYPIAQLWTGDNDGDQFMISIWTEMDKGKISLDDADVKAIIESIKVN